VVVIALGVGIMGLATGVNLLMVDRHEGWFSYAPDAAVTVSDGYFTAADDTSVLEQGLVWLAGLAVWTAASVWLLRTPARRGDHDG
jgi:hypothetical protein